MRLHLLAFGLVGGLLLAACDDTPPDRVVLEDVAVSGHRFIAVGAVHRAEPFYDGGPAALLTSDDGLAWQSVAVEAHAPLLAVAAGDGVVIAVGGDAYEGDAVSIVLRSTDDGETWERVATSAAEPLLDVTYGDGAFIAVSAGETFRSDDGGERWASVWKNPDDAFSWYPLGLQVGFGGGVFIRGERDEQNWISKDGGESWARDSSVGLAWVAEDGHAMIGAVLDDGCTGDGFGCERSDRSALARSEDGHLWPASDDRPGNDVTGYAVLGGQRVAPGRAGLMIDEGGGWSLLRDGSFDAVAADEARAVVIGAGVIVVGTAAGEWTDVALPAPETFGP